MATILKFFRYYEERLGEMKLDAYVSFGFFLFNRIFFT